MSILLCSQVYEGYGQTETAGVVCGTVPFEWVAGHVGVPFPCNWIKLADIPELNYFAKDRVGEICVKGANCTKGRFCLALISLYFLSFSYIGYLTL